MDADKVVKAFVKIRDARAALKAKYEEEDKALETQQDALSSHLLEVIEGTGANSLSTDYGTATRTVKSRIWTQNWEAMHNLVLETSNLDMLERRISQKVMEEFLANNPDKKPDGLCVDRKYVISVRRK